MNYCSSFTVLTPTTRTRRPLEHIRESRILTCNPQWPENRPRRRLQNESWGFAVNGKRGRRRIGDRRRWRGDPYLMAYRSVNVCSGWMGRRSEIRTERINSSNIGNESFCRTGAIKSDPTIIIPSIKASGDDEDAQRQWLAGWAQVRLNQIYWVCSIGIIAGNRTRSRTRSTHIHNCAPWNKWPANCEWPLHHKLSVHWTGD